MESSLSRSSHTGFFLSFAKRSAMSSMESVLLLICFFTALVRCCDPSLLQESVDTFDKCILDAKEKTDSSTVDIGSFYFCDCVTIFMNGISTENDCLGLVTLPGRSNTNVNFASVTSACEEHECDACTPVLEGSCDSLCTEHCGGSVVADVTSTAPPATSQATAPPASQAATQSASQTAAQTASEASTVNATGSQSQSASQSFTSSSAASSAAASSGASSSASSSSVSLNSTSFVSAYAQSYGCIYAPVVDRCNETTYDAAEGDDSCDISWSEYMYCSDLDQGIWPLLPSDYFEVGWPKNYFEGYLDLEDECQEPVVCPQTRLEECACTCCPEGQVPCEVDGFLQNPCDSVVDYNQKMCINPELEECPEGVVVLNSDCSSASSLFDYMKVSLIILSSLIYLFS